MGRIIVSSEVVASVPRRILTTICVLIKVTLVLVSVSSRGAVVIIMGAYATIGTISVGVKELCLTIAVIVEVTLRNVCVVILMVVMTPSIGVMIIMIVRMGRVIMHISMGHIGVRVGMGIGMRCIVVGIRSTINVSHIGMGDEMRALGTGDEMKPTVLSINPNRTWNPCVCSCPNIGNLENCLSIPVDIPEIVTIYPQGARSCNLLPNVVSRQIPLISIVIHEGEVVTIYPQ
jgi:hypothetical protein